ncbi:endonuclease [Methylosinus sp. C49]|uniref:endonuclease/exonuclease/phosphatase family protein n=1 Tax=Methylosinus sp. C49 TaxID=2699395 RepID=UPI00136711E1|nr:endonuclease/exonuclease/phosphatase family protein [Methylosinus sp. C49]BBU60886.1 endonuclease [Methylosinus sp. C49]
MAGHFRLATFNIENLDWSPSAQDEFDRRLAVLRPQLAAIDADILCLQEVDAQRETAHAPRRFIALDRLVEGGAYENFFRATTSRPGGDAPADIHNLALLSRWPIVERRQLYHDIIAPWRWTPPAETSARQPIDILFERPILYARVMLPDGASLHVLNLHLRAPRAVPLPGEADRKSSRAFAEGQWLAAQKREAQALEARLFVDRIFDVETAPLIAVCGDLNCDAYDAPARILWGAEEAAVGPRSLAPLALRIAERERFTVIHAGRKTLIDQILASPALASRCEEVVISNDGLADEATAQDPILGSLHAPLAARFRL